jgi:hypothetical protein
LAQVNSNVSIIRKGGIMGLRGRFIGGFLGGIPGAIIGDYIAGD